LDKAPDAFRTISEVADDLDIPQHVLRFWETRFNQIKPMKRSGGRRYYRPEDVDLLRGIRRLLYGEGYTIRGVQKILKEQGVRSVQALADGGPVQRGGADDAADDFAAREPSRPSSAPTHHDDDDEADDAQVPAEIDVEDDIDQLEIDADDPDEEPEQPAARPATARAEPVFSRSNLTRSDAEQQRQVEAAPMQARPREPERDRQQEFEYGASARPAAPVGGPGALSQAQTERLKAALEDLLACRKLIDAAFANPPTSKPE